MYTIPHLHKDSDLMMISPTWDERLVNVWGCSCSGTPEALGFLTTTLIFVFYILFSILCSLNSLSSMQLSSGTFNNIVQFPVTVIFRMLFCPHSQLFCAVPSKFDEPLSWSNCFILHLTSRINYRVDAVSFQGKAEHISVTACIK